MDTLSTSVSSFTVPTASRRKSIDVARHFKTNSVHNNCPKTSASSSIHHVSSRRNSSSNLRSEFFTAVHPRSPPAAKQHPSAAAVHRRAASGYAAALVDVARCHDSLEAVRRDARRVRKWIGNERLSAALLDPRNEVKGEILRLMAEKGKIHKLLGGLLKNLAEKNRAMLLSEVLEEFERIYDELCGTARVVLLSAAEIGDGNATSFSVAQKVHQISGAWKVKVSRRSLGAAV